MRYFSQWHLEDAMFDFPHPEPVEGRTGSNAARLKRQTETRRPAAEP
jgi:hypothetical protein